MDPQAHSQKSNLKEEDSRWLLLMSCVALKSYNGRDERAPQGNHKIHSGSVQLSDTSRKVLGLTEHQAMGECKGGLDDSTGKRQRSQGKLSMPAQGGAA